MATVLHETWRMRHAPPPAVTVLAAIVMIVIAALCLMDFFDSHATGAHLPLALAAATLLPVFLALHHRFAPALVLSPLGAALAPSTPPPRF